MNYILHGDDIVASRKRLLELTKELPVTSYDGKSLSLAELEDSLLSTGLFENEKAIVVENLLSKNSKKKEFGKLLDSIEVNQLLVFWEDKKLPKTSISIIKNASVEDFLLPSFYFRFLDTLSPRNKKQSFTLYHDLLTTYAAEQVFYSLLKRVRQLVILSTGASNDELLKMPSWQLGNLKRQLTSWNKDSLHEFYNSLKDTEIRLKTGGLPVSLSKHLDILLLSKLT